MMSQGSHRRRLEEEVLQRSHSAVQLNSPNFHFLWLLIFLLTVLKYLLCFWNIKNLKLFHRDLSIFSIIFCIVWVVHHTFLNIFNDFYWYFAIIWGFFFPYPAILNVNISYVGPGYNSEYICIFVMYQMHRHLEKTLPVQVHLFCFIYCLIDTGSSCFLRFVFRISGKSVIWDMLNLDSTLLFYVVSPNYFNSFPHMGI